MAKRQITLSVAFIILCITGMFNILNQVMISIRHPLNMKWDLPTQDVAGILTGLSILVVLLCVVFPAHQEHPKWIRRMGVIAIVIYAVCIVLGRVFMYLEVHRFLA